MVIALVSKRGIPEDHISLTIHLDERGVDPYADGKID